MLVCCWGGSGNISVIVVFFLNGVLNCYSVEILRGVIRKYGLWRIREFRLKIFKVRGIDE